MQPSSAVERRISNREEEAKNISCVGEGFCWNFNRSGPQKNATMRHKSLSLVVLWSCLLPGLSLQSPGLSLQSPVGPPQDVIMVGIVNGISTPSHKEWAGSRSDTSVCSKIAGMSPKPRGAGVSALRGV